jgi:hypothetical protein
VATKNSLRLRGHHLGCVLHDLRTPSDHPTVPKACAWLRANPTGTVHVVVGPDDICLPCPQWDGTTCLRGFEQLNQGKDRRFLALLGMKDGEGLPARELYQRLMARMVLAFLTEVCAGCSPKVCAEAAKGEMPF